VTLTTNILGIDRDIKNRKKNLIEHNPYRVGQKIGELWSTQSTDKKVIGANVDLPRVNNARSVYANAFEFGPSDFATGGSSTPKFSHSGTYGAGRTNVGLCPKFLVMV